MQRSSATIGLVLIGTTLAAAGYDAYQVHKSANARDSFFDDGDFGSSTRPSYGSSGWYGSPGYSGTHYYHSDGTSWSSDEYRRGSSTSGHSSSFHSSTSRGGFGSSGHSSGS